MLALLVVSALTLAFKIESISADDGTIYINADGSINPSTAPIYTADNITYTLTGNFTADADAIVIERNNIVLDGAGYTLTGSGRWSGITLTNISGVTVRNMTIENFDFGIDLESSSNCTFSGNTVVNNFEGINVSSSSNCTLLGNNVTANNDLGIYLIDFSNDNSLVSNEVDGNYRGIELHDSMNNNMFQNQIENIWFDIRFLRSDNNTICENDIGYSADGIWLDASSGNLIYHNLCISLVASSVPSNYTNSWDGGYPSGGNYWSGYNGTDLYSGPYQNVTGSDGIGDTPYVINANNTDYYPLMGMFSDFNVAQGVDVQVVSNSTVSDFQFNGTALQFNVTGENGTTGFCRVCFPTALINGTLKVFVNGTQMCYSLLPSSNSNMTCLYLTYNHSTERVVILPEFPSALVLLLSMIATLLAVIIYKKKAVKVSKS